MQRGDGTYEVFLTDVNGKLIGNKRMKGNKKKGVINLKTIDEKTASARNGEVHRETRWQVQHHSSGGKAEISM
jgi:hypothetical protein